VQRWATAWLLGVLLASSSGLAAPKSFTWRAPPECPGALSMESRISTALGKDFRALEAEPSETVFAAVTHQGASYLLLLSIGEANEGRQRRMEFASCGEAAEAAAIAIALALDEHEDFSYEGRDEGPVSLSETKDSPPAPEPISAALPPAPPPLVRDRPTAPVRTRARPWGIGLAAALDVGSFRVPAAGPALSTFYQLNSFRPFASFTWFPPTSIGDNARLQMGLLAAGVCSFQSEPSLGAGACASIESGWLWAESVGDDSTERVDAPWMAGTLGLGLNVPAFDLVNLNVRLDAVFPFTRHTFLLAEGSVHRLAQTTLRGHIGFDTRFP